MGYIKLHNTRSRKMGLFVFNVLNIVSQNIIKIADIKQASESWYNYSIFVFSNIKKSEIFK